MWDGHLQTSPDVGVSERRPRAHEPVLCKYALQGVPTSGRGCFCAVHGACRAQPPSSPCTVALTQGGTRCPDPSPWLVWSLHSQRAEPQLPRGQNQPFTAHADPSPTFTAHADPRRPDEHGSHSSCPRPRAPSLFSPLSELVKSPRSDCRCVAGAVWPAGTLARARQHPAASTSPVP